MKIHVGSKNQTKVQAVREAVKLYPKLFPNPKIVDMDVDIDKFGHPKDIHETVQGAVDRAKKTFKNCSYSIGIESGLIEIPYTRSGLMEISVCAVFDEKKLCIGLSPAFEWPTEVTKMIVSGEADASQAFHKLGYSQYEKLGSQPGGAISYLTEGRLTREACIKYSIIMALIQLEKHQYYH